MARTSYLNPQLYNKLYAVMQYDNALALRTCLETGWRVDDVLHLKTSDLTGRTLRCVAQKTGKPDRKVISADLAKRLKQVANNGRLFDGRFGNKPRTRQTVWRDVKKAAKLLNLDGNIAPHSARKTYAVEDFKDNGLAVTMRDLQHDRVSTTLIYAFADLIDCKQTAGCDAGAAAFERSDKSALSDNTDSATNDCGNAAPTRIAQNKAIMDFAEIIAAKVADKIAPLFGVDNVQAL